MRSARRRQQGQAMVEALLLLPGLILVFLAIAWMGRLQFTAQTLLQVSRKAAMMAAAGAPDSRQSGFQVRVEHARLRSGADRFDQALPQAEWLGGEAGLVSATARGNVAGMGPWGAMTLRRRTHVAMGSGHARNDVDAGHRIATAMATWGQVADHSRAAARAAAQAAAVADAPWRRAPLSLDWLSPWADVVPADKLFSAGRAGQ